MFDLQTVEYLPIFIRDGRIARPCASYLIASVPLCVAQFNFIVTEVVHCVGVIVFMGSRHFITSLVVIHKAIKPYGFHDFVIIEQSEIMFIFGVAERKIIAYRPFTDCE